MHVTLSHFTNDKEEYQLQACVNLKVPKVTENRIYYWGLNFKPNEPVTERKWDGIRWHA